ncbi:MAG: hypothetical protein AAF533_04140 [Acidobacteriota bacterium]
MSQFDGGRVSESGSVSAWGGSSRVGGRRRSDAGDDVDEGAVAPLLEVLPAEIRARLRVRAMEEGRSEAAELLVLLRDELGVDEPSRPALTEIDRWRVRAQRPLSLELIRTAREHGRP